MLREVRADGFRSLEKFSMAIRPGLNVLVGPNGGGKTNILALISFLTELAREQLPDAISASGGVSKVFKKLATGSFQRSLRVGLTASIDLQETIIYFGPKSRSAFQQAGVTSVDYTWDCEIDAANGYDQAVFGRQELKVIINTPDQENRHLNEYDFMLSVTTKPGSVVFEENIRTPELAALVHQSSEPDESGSFFTVDDDHSSRAGIVPIFFAFENTVLRWLAYTLHGGTIFNFDPSACKRSDDSARSPTLEKDGSGLAAAISAIQKADSPGPTLWRLPVERQYYEKGTFKNLQTYFRLINRSIVSLEPVNDPVTNKITVEISILGEDESFVRFPLDFASDGTVKWLAFNVALLTQKGGFAIEEPENFLHPEIQRHAIELVRAELGTDKNAYVMMTTHSESLLNASDPAEIVVVSMNEGVTAAKRLNDPLRISEEVRETGFGLGYYYLAGAFDD